MNFQEKDLVDLWWKNKECPVWDFLPRMDTLTGRNLTAHREYVLPSQRRCDVLVKGKSGRFVWVIEAKVVAFPDAIMQAHQYLKELAETTRPGSWIKQGYITIAAQFFRDETLFFAERMGVQCLHLTPINQQTIRVEQIRPHSEMHARQEMKQFCPRPYRLGRSSPPFQILSPPIGAQNGQAIN